MKWVLFLHIKTHRNPMSLICYLWTLPSPLGQQHNNQMDLTKIWRGPLWSPFSAKSSFNDLLRTLHSYVIWLV